MYTVKMNKENTILIKKSKFISQIYFVNTVTEANSIINKVKDKYKDATHVCFGYIIDNNIKYSDDNEPNNTAGMPIYNALYKNNLNHVLAIVIRYFGGIKLGAGGLVRAYSNSISEIINNNITELIKGYEVEIKLDYDNIKEVEFILKDTNITNKFFKENIIISFSTDNIDVVKTKLNNYIKEFKVVKEIYIRK